MTYKKIHVYLFHICIEQKKSACELYRSPLFFLFTHWFERIHSLPGQKVDTKLV